MNAPTWTCDECGQPTTTGWLICDPHAANTSPRPIAWGVYCGPHTPRVDLDDYAVTLARLDTREAVNELQSHLEDKRWYSNTTWPNCGQQNTEAAA